MSQDLSLENVTEFLVHTFCMHERIFRLYQVPDRTLTFVFIKDVFDRYVRSKYSKSWGKIKSSRSEQENIFAVQVFGILSDRHDCSIKWQVRSFDGRSMPILLLTEESCKSTIIFPDIVRGPVDCSCQVDVIAPVRKGNFFSTSVLWPVLPIRCHNAISMTKSMSPAPPASECTLWLVGEIERQVAELDRRKKHLADWTDDLKKREAALAHHNQIIGPIIKALHEIAATARDGQ